MVSSFILESRDDCDLDAFVSRIKNRDIELVERNSDDSGFAGRLIVCVGVKVPLNGIILYFKLS
jgi:hypothetical protein